MYRKILVALENGRADAALVAHVTPGQQEELALDAAHKAKDAWGKTAPAKRAARRRRT